MVAVLTVFACHLWDWPQGGFIGVDVFFVISGFLITGNLLRGAEETGTVSFTGFYWNRIRRILPAATVVLVLTYVASTLVFLPFRSRQVGVDALFAFPFAANWRFAFQDTDYFNTNASVSPIQHYWSLSIEEQFYFVWPAVIFVISIFVLRKAWTHEHRMRIAGSVMVVIVVLSLGWAIYQTQTSPTWAYFDTFARVWELGVGAVLATAVGWLAQIPVKLKPVLSWAGIALIAASVFLINGESAGFPAPWALLPVVGASLVIAAGVGEEPKYQAFLRNPVSGYIGDISYSLYLVHWPVIVLLGAVMDRGAYFSLTVLALGLALAIASFQFVETPLRRAEWGKLRAAMHEISRGRYRPQRSNGFAAIGVIALATVALIGYAQRPEAFAVATLPPPIAVVAAEDKTDPSIPEMRVGPLATGLQAEIAAALQATEWPSLDPPLETVFESPISDAATMPCVKDAPTVDPANCLYGSPTAPLRIILAGDSEGLSYAVPLREIAVNSNGQVQLLNMAMGSCAFTDELLRKETLSANCDARKRNVVDTINATKPDVVIITNLYRLGRTSDVGRMSPGEWSDSTRRLIDQFRPNAGMIVFMSGPPGEVDIQECFGKRSSVPADCIGRVNKQWKDMASVEQKLADSLGGKWIDSRPWFCNGGQLCPSFAGGTATKSDAFHMAPVYGAKIYPVIEESLRDAGVLK